LLIGSGANVSFVSQQLGHKSPDITLKVYTHEFNRAEHEETTWRLLEESFGSSLVASGLEGAPKDSDTALPLVGEVAACRVGARGVELRLMAAGRKVLPPISMLAVTAVTACGGSDQSVQAGGASQTRASTTAIATTTTATLPGGSVPQKLQGTWLLESEYPVPVRLYLYEDRYAISAGGSAQGDIVVNGDELAFFNSNAPSCPLRLPEGVGRYRWRLTGDKLHLTEIGNDPCGGRSPVLTDATYVRTE
jgi:hypothetical protein